MRANHCEPRCSRLEHAAPEQNNPPSPFPVARQPALPDHVHGKHWLQTPATNRQADACERSYVLVSLSQLNKANEAVKANMKRKHACSVKERRLPSVHPQYNQLGQTGLRIWPKHLHCCACMCSISVQAAAAAAAAAAAGANCLADQSAAGKKQHRHIHAKISCSSCKAANKIVCGSEAIHPTYTFMIW